MRKDTKNTIKAVAVIIGAVAIPLALYGIMYGVSKLAQYFC